MLLIYTLTRDRIEYTRRFLDQLGEVDNHIILDNGSIDGTQKFLKTTDKKVIYNKTNEGIWKGIEKIMQTENFDDYDLILKLDNDLEFPQEGWLKKLVETYEKRNFDMLSPFVEGICNGAGGLQRRETKSGIGVVSHLGGACLLTRPEFYKKPMEYGAKASGWDSWFCAGRRCGIVEEIRVKHDTVAQERDMPDYYKRKVKEAS